MYVSLVKVESNNYYSIMITMTMTKKVRQDTHERARSGVVRRFPVLMNCYVIDVS